MGLDMYLTKRTYVQNWDHYPPEQRHEVTVKLGGKSHPNIKSERVSEIVEQVAYWRKANAIHQWFVREVQEGRDECQESYVSHEQLRELVSLCKKVLDALETVEGDVKVGQRYTQEGGWEDLTKPGKLIAQKGLAEKLLPTQEGFFFGSTDYDEYYVQDLQSTIDQIEPLLAEDDGDFYYRASW